MTKVQIELPDATAEAARAAGLLTSDALDRLLSNALRKQQAADRLLGIADKVTAAGVSPMSESEIRDELKAAREAKRRRAAGN
jgi:hypothetical protein